MKNIFFGIFLTINLLAYSPCYSQVNILDKLNPNNWNKKEVVVEEKSFEELKETPIGGKVGERIKTYMLANAQQLNKLDGTIVSTIRNGEIIKVSIPGMKLFNPNDTVLFSDADKYFKPIMSEAKDSLVSIVITSHYDDTGTPQFINKICEARGNAIYKWFLSNGLNKRQVSAYSYGSDSPLFENTSMENRGKNRRVTIYLIPTQEMYRLGKKNKLKKGK